jgi:hypothetical protein
MRRTKGAGRAIAPPQFQKKEKKKKEKEKIKN